MNAETNIIRIACADQPGLMAAVTGLLFRLGGNVIENGEYVDKEQGLFFMRTTFEGDLDTESVRRELCEMLPDTADIDCFRQRRKKTVVLATKEAHCLGDLLIRSMFGDLYADISAVISNHTTLEELTTRLGFPFHAVNHLDLSRSQHEAQLLEIIHEYEPDYIVMAKYMRILSEDFIAQFENRIINIHHSFLPAFVGANPYRQAHERGVKIIGATAHFASRDLDEGPIIAQGTIPVNHAHSVKSMIRNGRDVEKTVLARALQLVFEDRVFVHGNRTIVFE